MKCPFLQNYTNDETFSDCLVKKSQRKICHEDSCLGSLMNQGARNKALSNEEVYKKAKDFMTEYFGNKTEECQQRLEAIQGDIEETGSYELTKDELEFGARTAWRNASRCPARISWQNLSLFDQRDVDTPDEMFQAIMRHIKASFNDGKIKPSITVFRPRSKKIGDPRVWNGLGISYAGYRQEDGSIVGDPGNVDFTEFCQSLGWKGAGGMFDFLPIIISGTDGVPHWYQLPDDVVTRIKIQHPTNEAINSFNLEWFGLPLVAGLMLEVGGVQFPAAPFSGWYTGAEIANRDLLDIQRYNLLKPIAAKMGLDVNNNSNLWRDKVALDLNLAVLSSYQTAGVTIVDHYTQSDQFLAHMKSEYQVRGGCPADWVWIVPPQSGSLVTSYHQEMVNYHLSPAYEYQDKLWMNYGKSNVRKTLRSVSWALLLWSGIYKKLMKKREKVTIFYASETGTAKNFAHKASNLFKTTFNCQVAPVNHSCSNVIDMINSSKAVIFITSTFGNGEPPTMAIDFNKKVEYQVDKLKDDVCIIGEEYDKFELTKNLNFAVFALGSTAYPNFAAFGKNLDKNLHILGGRRISNVGVGDELDNQEGSFKSWLQHTFLTVCQELRVKTTPMKLARAISIMTEEEPAIDNSNYRWRMLENRKPLCQVLSNSHNVKVKELNLTRREHLHDQVDQPSSILVSLTPNLDNQDYEPGDHLGICPANSEEDIALIKNHFEKCPPLDFPVALEKNQGVKSPWLPVEEYPRGLTLNQLLHYYIDFRSSPSQSLLALFAKNAKIESERKQLEDLSSKHELYKEWKKKNEPSLIDTFNMFSSVKVCSATLTSQLPVIRPRRYSIASTSSWEGQDVGLVVGVVDYQDKLGKRKYGLTTGQLLHSPLGANFYGFLRSETGFRLPENSEKDVIMIAAGSGIAPFRGFWMKRAELFQQGNKVGNTILYFGCRNEKMNLLKNETDRLALSGMKMVRKVAFSREADREKQYVQDILEDDSSEIIRYIRSGASIYVCGKVSMAQAVQMVLKKILMRYQGCNEEDAQKIILKMKKEKLYCEDIFG